MDLADVAGRVVVAACVVPRPSKHPQHVHTVLVAVAVVRFVVVPRRVGQWLVAGDPVPVSLRVLVSGSGPEVTVSDVWNETIEKLV